MTFTQFTTFTISTTYIDGNPFPVTNSFITSGYSSIIIYTQISTLTELTEFQAEGTEVSDKDSSLIYIIIGVVGGLILLIIIAIIIWFMVFHKKEDSSTSILEMDEETILSVPTTNAIVVTNDNPLWTTSVMTESDDPFKNDFEETRQEGFFHVKDRVI